MNFIKFFLSPDHPTKSISTQNIEINEYKQAVKEKEALVRNHLGRIRELETELSDLKARQSSLVYAMKSPNLDDSELAKIVLSYDSVIEKLMEERQHLLADKSDLENHIMNLENNFVKLLEQYKKSRVMIDEIVNRAKLYNEQMQEYQQKIQDLKRKHKTLTEFTHSKIVEVELERYKRQYESQQIKYIDVVQPISNSQEGVETNGKTGEVGLTKDENVLEQ